VNQLGPTARPLLIRRAQYADLPATAELHAALLPHGLFPRLGAGFLQRWHATYLAGEHAVAYVAVGPRGQAAPGAAPTFDGDVVGFLLGATDQGAHVEAVIAAHRRELVLAGAAALLVRPALAVHFLRTRALRYLRRLLRRRPGARTAPTGQSSADGVATAPPVAVVTAVAVVPAARGAGVGVRLLEMFLVEARSAGAPAAELVTQADREGASAFYTRLGWIAQDVHPDHDGAMVRRFRRDLATGSSLGDNRTDPDIRTDVRVRTDLSQRGDRGDRGDRADRGERTHRGRRSERG
jgi:ribosomal protein S18 acetylase RimI-like enzyme